MDNLSPGIRDLARRLLTLEAANSSVDDAHGHALGRVFEKLQVSLTRLTGADGYRALMRRALALARAEAPELQGITESSDGTLERLQEGVGADGKPIDSGAVIVIANLLGLLVIFIGEPLMMRLIREVWPDVSLGK